MKVVLVFPGITGIGFNSYGKGMDTSWISHGLCSISAYAKSKGFAVELVDLRCLKGWGDFKRVIREKRPDVIGMTMMSVDYNPALKCLKLIKQVSPRTVTVVGGPHPSIETAELESEKEIDHIITGEGEISFTELLQNVEKATVSPRVIKGVPPQELDELPFADRELFRDHEFPLPVEGFEAPFVTVIAGRGCKYNCNFCQPAERLIFGAKVRRRSPANIIRELEFLRDKFAFKSVMFHDDCITEDRGWVMEFCRLYTAKGFMQPFACQSRADIICANEDMVALMAQSGLKLMFIGFESGNQRVLNFLRKGVKVEQNYKAAEICRKYGVHIWANYMLGIPTETREEAMDTVRMMQAIKPEHYSPAFYTPHPGSDLFNYCQEQGLSLIRSHDSYRRNPTEAKIKGLDYDFLYTALKESVGMKPFSRNRFLVRAERSMYFFCFRYRLIRLVISSLLRLTGKKF
jgi:anaerobic magnesium-protoporphyrin IX monomethyl ester cyclase